MPDPIADKGCAIASALRERPAVLFATMKALGGRGVVAGPWVRTLTGHAREYPEGDLACEIRYDGENDGWFWWARRPDGSTWSNDVERLVSSPGAAAKAAQDCLVTRGVVLVEPNARPWEKQ